MESELRERIEAEVESLRALRDELRVRIHLGAAEAKDAFEEAEKGWSQLEGRLKVIRDVAQESAEDVGEASRLLASEIRRAYDTVRKHL